MKFEIDGSALRTGGYRLLGALILLSASVGRLAMTARSAGKKTGRGLAAGGSSAVSRGREALTGRRAERLARGAWRGLVGRRTDVSAAAFLLAPLLALGTGWWVADAYGYRRIERWALGTWSGSDPHLIVFVGVAALVALAAAFAAWNSGLLPSIVLAMGPVFGIGLARYGLTVEFYGTVGVPNAISVAAILALLFGVPIGTAGFVLGTLARRAIGRFGRRRGDGAVIENA